MSTNLILPFPSWCRSFAEIRALAADAPKSSTFALPTHIASGVTGDFDELLKRRGLRISVVPNRTHFFVDRVSDARHHVRRFRAFEKFLNKKHKTGELPLKIAFIPVSRDKIVEALNAGRGDVAAADLTITPEREAGRVLRSRDAEHR